MKITFNDSPRDTSAQTVEELVAEALGSVPEAGTAVAVDGDVVPRSAWAQTPLTEGARVDLLTAVQGG
ncbi:sulfur carrier protein ThiS [Corynebacterium timonense]|uniref:Sulfur carrier protein n=1 Tax=Corynebacterium timonense TaxID=441500 RepID=A0A1H1RJW6_9CORY|nr:sulfur carrier protein ThiS [Corynebacterium timonense]SDS35988.1 sulfur carrier protein [Corynebacterium timonense]